MKKDTATCNKISLFWKIHHERQTLQAQEEQEKCWTQAGAGVSKGEKRQENRIFLWLRAVNCGWNKGRQTKEAKAATTEEEGKHNNHNNKVRHQMRRTLLRDKCLLQQIEWAHCFDFGHETRRLSSAEKEALDNNLFCIIIKLAINVVEQIATKTWSLLCWGGVNRPHQTMCYSLNRNDSVKTGVTFSCLRCISLKLPTPPPPPPSLSLALAWRLPHTQ